MTPTVFMDAEVSPHRSLPPSGLKALLGLMLALDLGLGAVLMALHAVFVAPFALVGAIGLCVAFAASNRRMGERERIWVGIREVRVLRGPAEAETVVWSAPVWASRVDTLEIEPGVCSVRLRAQGQSILVGGALSAPERMSLARALDAALARARAA